jgi:hypothetical protein
MWFEGWKSSSVLSIVNMIFEFHWKIKNSLIDENSQRKPPTCRKSLTNFIVYTLP